MRRMNMVFTIAMREILLLAAVAALVNAQDGGVDRVSVPLSDPNRPVMLKVGILTGSISVKAYNGKEVVVEIKQLPDEDEEDSRKGKGKDGMRLIPNTSAGITIEEEDN